MHPETCVAILNWWTLAMTIVAVSVAFMTTVYLAVDIWKHRNPKA